MQIDKRKFIRINFHAKGVFKSQKDKDFQFELINISLKGLLSKKISSGEIPLKAEGLLTIYLSSSDQVISVKSRLLHKHDDYYGFVFLEMEINSMIHLRNLLISNTARENKIKAELSFLIKQYKIDLKAT
jgi:hypothetical protein